MAKKKILFLMLDHPSSPWNYLYENGVETTWKPNSYHVYLRYQGIVRFPKVFSIMNRFEISTYGNLIKRWYLQNLKSENLKWNRAWIDGNILKIPIRDDWWLHGVKTLNALSYAIENFEFDYLVRGNASLYCNIDKLCEILEEREIFYGGPIEKNKLFASGWALVLSREAVKVLLNGDFSFFAKYFDDEAIGNTFAKVGIEPTEIEYLTLSDCESLERIPSSLLKEYPFIRTKAYDYQGHRVDYKIMWHINKMISGTT